MVPHPTPAGDSRPELPTVHLVDDDAGVRAALRRLLLSHDYQVCTYESGEDFLSRFDGSAPGCLVIDVAMPGIGGVELLRQLHAAGERPAAVFLSGQADIRTCAQALRHGAVHFLTKPVDEAALLGALEEAVRHDAALRREQRQQALVAARLASLTPREREVLAHVMDGRLNKQIASDLGTAEKTVKVHRARGMDKMGVRSVAELVKMVERAHLAASEAEVVSRGRGADACTVPPSTLNDSVPWYRTSLTARGCPELPALRVR
jgi:FixJ family two-component response regulator